VKITHVARAGTADVTRASIALHLAANGSVDVGQQPLIALGRDAPELLLAARYASLLRSDSSGGIIATPSATSALGGRDGGRFS